MHPLVVGLAGLIAGLWLWGRPRRLPAPSGTSPGDAPPTTVIIPARDEATVLPLLLADLESQVRPGLEVVVVDDHSSDDTVAVARSFGFVRVVSAPALPDGWTGKSWACQAGVDGLAEPANDAVLIFLDADVRLAPGALAAITDELAVEGGLLSVQPYHATERAYEQLSLFPGIVSILGTGVGRRSGPPSGAFGPVLATRHDVYSALGGHREVRADIAEDVALGLRYRDGGEPVRIRLGANRITFRMYPAGLGQLVEGWTKNMATGATAVPLHRSLLTALWITAAGSAALGLPFVPGQGDLSPYLGGALYAAFVLQVALMGRALGTFKLGTAFVYPVALITFMALFLRSVWRSKIVGNVRWRGRTIAVDAPAAPT